MIIPLWTAVVTILAFTNAIPQRVIEIGPPITNAINTKELQQCVDNNVYAPGWAQICIDIVIKKQSEAKKLCSQTCEPFNAEGCYNKCVEKLLGPI